MSSNETNRIVNYTDLTYQDIMAQVDNLFKSDERFKNYNDGELSVLFSELFAGVADMLNYNIERASEEVYIDTAKRYRSAVKLSRNLNYDITRPIPAKARIKFVVDRNTIGESKVVSIPQFTTVTYNGLPYVTAQAVTINVGANDNIAESTEVEIYQGEFKTIRFPGLNNAQINRQYQRYYIDDPSFADFYGEKDYQNGNFTLVGIGDTSFDALDETSGNLYDIRRTSLLAEDKIDAFTFNTAQVAPRYKICLVRTSAESEDGKGVEIRFGDGTFVDNGLKNTGSSIYVRYFSTQGSKANELGIIGNNLGINSNNTISYDGLNTSFLTAELTTNITGGGDLETIESIESNAPGVFQTFDRLITKLDYTSYLKSLTSPFDVQNAMAWGEQEELENINYHQPETVNATNVKQAISKLFNVIMFSAIGKLYSQNVNTGRYEPNIDYSSIVVDNDLSSYRYPSQNYINVLGADEVAGQLYFQQQQFNAKFTSVDLAGASNNQTVFFKGYTNFYNEVMPVYSNESWARYTTTTEQDDLGLNQTVTVPGSYRDIPLNFNITVTDSTGEAKEINLLTDSTFRKTNTDPYTWEGAYICRKPFWENTDGDNKGLVINSTTASGTNAEVLGGLLGEIIDENNDYVAPYYTAWGDVAENIENFLNRQIVRSPYANQANIRFSVSCNIEQDNDFIAALRDKIRTYHNASGLSADEMKRNLKDIQNDRLGVTYNKYITFGVTMSSNSFNYDEFSITVNTQYTEVEKSLCFDGTTGTALTNNNTCQNGDTIDSNAYYYGVITDYSYDLVKKDEISNNLFGLNGKESYLLFNNDNYNNSLSFTENVNTIIQALDNKSQITCRHIYVSPIIQTFGIEGNINLRSGVNGDDVLIRLKDKFYQWANQNVDFNINVYKSNIMKIINSFNEVVSANIQIKPRDIKSKPLGRKYFFDVDSFADGTHFIYTNMPGYDNVNNQIISGSTVEKFQEIVYYNVNSYLRKYRVNDPESDVNIKNVSDPSSPSYDVNSPLYDARYDSSRGEYDPSLYGPRYTSDVSSKEIYSNSLWSGNNTPYQNDVYYTEDKTWYWSNEITERTFLYELVNGIVKDCTGRGRSGIGPILTTDGNTERYNITKMPEFYAFINEIHLDFDEIIKSNIVNTEGDIAPLYESIANTYGIKYERKSSGGFSLKNEIPQFVMDVDYSYV
jgi:hypothetical protein